VNASTGVFDFIRVLSLGFSIATSALIIHFWRKYPVYRPQFVTILFYQLHRIVFYSVLLVSHASPVDLVTSGFLNNWSAVITFHSACTWFFVAFMYFWPRGSRRDR
jgi:hypothetical protein